MGGMATSLRTSLGTSLGTNIITRRALPVALYRGPRRPRLYVLCFSIINDSYIGKPVISVTNFFSR